MDWPYPVAYGKENEIEADVLVLGGGVAGCHAAISAAKRGSSVVVVEKGATIRSGSGGPGVDHWHGACTNPCSRITPKELVELTGKLNNGYLFPEYGNGITSYILFNESWDALQDVESWGVEVRDVDDEFVGAEFRDEETKLLFAYDYDNRFTIRVNGGADIKVAMHKEMKRLGEMAENGRLTQTEMSDGTFTISNAGRFGSLFFVPIINQPESAILGVGTIAKRPVVVEDKIEVRPMVYISVSYDHRIIPGAIAQQFLETVKLGIENISG